jgi:phosphoglycolate phosphatase-like HAD superfamily hydrolase
MSGAFMEAFGVADAFAGIAMPGRTDSWLLAAALERQGIARGDPRVARYRDIYLTHLAHELVQPPPPGVPHGVLPGVRSLLDDLTSHHDDYLGLLTGNFEPAAKMKLEHFDLCRYFRCGAFGDEAADRNHLLERALANVAACGGPAVSSHEAVVIGDTPLDIGVAKYGHARSIGVATGSHGVDDLRAAGADVVFKDLSDTAAVVRALHAR